MASETHTGEDVPVYARGPGANLVSGTIEQNEIFHILARSLGLAD
jgi:alkaline phosphatase